MITSGLLRALQGKGIEDIVELKVSDRKALVNEFVSGWNTISKSKQDILIPQIEYLTNDSWEEISAINGASGWPILHRAQYSKANLYVLTIPDNFSDLYQYPAEVLNGIRRIVAQDFPVRLEGPAQVSLFCYDNGTFIVESFLNETVTVKIAAKDPIASLQNLVSNETLQGTVLTNPFARNRQVAPERTFEITLKPHSFKVFKAL